MTYSYIVACITCTRTNGTVSLQQALDKTENYQLLEGFFKTLKKSVQRYIIIGH